MNIVGIAEFFRQDEQDEQDVFRDLLGYPVNPIHPVKRIPDKHTNIAQFRQVFREPDTIRKSICLT
jgi:hypothetical protein